MNNGYKKYSKIFDVAKFTARKWYKEYDLIFLSAGMDAEDLIQETQLKAVEIIQRNPDKEVTEVFKLSNKHIKWRLHDLLGRAKKSIVVLKPTNGSNEIKEDTSRTLPRVKLTFQDEESKKEELKERILFPLEYNEDTMISSRGKHVLYFQELLTVLDNREYYTLFQVMHFSTSIKDIAKQLHCSRRWAYQIYNRALKKVEKYLKEQVTLGLKRI